LVLLALAVAGCKAGVTVPPMTDLAQNEDLSASLDGGADFAPAPPDLRCSMSADAEVCGNGCDDDRNGYTDDDDPACTTQFLATVPGGSSPALYRLQLEPVPRLIAVDHNAVPGSSAATFRRAFSPAAYLAVEGGSRQLRRILLADGGTGAFSDFFTTFDVRDVCVFNNELIVVERALSSNLHRFQADGQTEIGPVALGSVIATACASDGPHLYVAVHTATGPSQFLLFDKNYNQVGAAIDVPPALAAAGLSRCLSLAWSKRANSFYGLFGDISVNDASGFASQLFPFAFDGGAGSPVDAGTYRAIGEFLP
jgi:hypothetical protein